MSEYIDARSEMLARLQLARTPKEKKPKTRINPVSKKKMAQIETERAMRGGGETSKQKWFVERRKELTGTCQCGCGEPSQTGPTLYRHCCCHILPQENFKSVQLHPINFVERRFYGGCHTNMDTKGLDHWPNMADWENIKQRVLKMEPLLTREEKATRFFTKLRELIEKN